MEKKQTKFGGITLTSRECDCLKYCAEGKTAKETAEALGISKRTVENHIQRIKIKFGCNKKSDLVIRLYDIPELAELLGLKQVQSVTSNSEQGVTQEA